MTSTAKSIFYYSFYMMGVGLGLFFLPNPILAVFGFEITTDIWVRVLGLMVFCTGMLYMYCGLTDQIGFFRISIPERVIFFLGTLTLVNLFDVSPMLAIIGSVDLFGAAWTGLALRRDDY